MQGSKTNDVRDSQALNTDLETGCHQGPRGSLVEQGCLLAGCILSAEHGDYRRVALSLVF